MTTTQDHPNTTSAAAPGAAARETTGTVTLPDGRALAYTTLGGPAGATVVVLDGPGSRGLARALAPAAAAAGVRLVAPDRPGFGGSDAQLGRTIADWPADHAALLDALGIERAGVIGQSAGTPFALAAAAALPARVPALALLGAISPFNEPGAMDGVKGPLKVSIPLARRAPWLLRRLLRFAARQDPAKAAARFIREAPPADRAVLEDPALRALHEQASAEVLANPAALVAEMRLVARDWGIDVGTVRAPVRFWSGTADTTHPPYMSERMAERLGGAPIVAVRDAGTFGLLPHYPEVLRFAAGQ